MDYKLEELIDVNLLQSLQEKLNNIYSFPSAIIDNDGKILTAVAWQDLCTKFHRQHPESEKECIESDKYILEHLHEASPAVSYKCPHGLIDNATPIIIDGKHLGNFFTGQFFLDQKPEIEFFKQQAIKFGFDEAEYLNAVEKVPVWTKEKLYHYLDFIKGFIEVIASIGLKNLREIEANEKIKQDEKLIEAEKQRLSYILEGTNVGTWEWNIVTGETVLNERWADIIGYTLEEISPISINTWVNFVHPDDVEKSNELLQKHFKGELDYYEFESRIKHKNGDWIWALDKGKVYEWDALGNPLKMAGTHQDITDRKLSEQALKESETNLRSVINNSPVGFHIYMIDANNRLIFRMSNASANSILHVNHQQYIGKEILEAFPALAGSGIPEMYLAIAKGELQTQNFEMPYNYNDIGGVYEVRVFQGAPGQVVVNFIDISERRRAEVALQQSESKFRGLFQNTASGMVLSSLQNKFLQVNEAFCNMLGYSEDELLGLSFLNITYPEDKEIGAEIFKEIIDGKRISAQFEKRYLHKNGKIIWGLISTTLFRGIENQPVYLVTQVVDITLRKQAEESLKQNQIILNSLLNGIPESAMLIDTEGNILAANETIEKRITNGKKSLIGDNAFRILPEDVAIQRKEKLKLAIELKKPLRFEDTRLGKTYYNCLTPIISDNGNVEVIAVIGIDITDRVNAEKALKENQELLSLYILNSPVYTYIKEVTPTQSKVLEASNSFVNMIGIKAEDMIGMTMDDLFPPEFAKKITEDDWAVVSSGKTLQMDEYLNGRNYVTIKFPIKKENRNLLAGYTIDITERKQVEMELEKHKNHLEELVKIRTEELERANELLRVEIEKEKEFEIKLQNTLNKEKELSDMKTRFISTTSHEFRTPLTTILFSTDLLKHYGEKWTTDKKDEHYTKISNSVRYLTNLLEDILTLNRAESGKMKYEPVKIDLKTFIMDCVADAKTLISNKHEINLFYKLRENEFVLDPKLMKFIFNNLLSNAVKYSPNGGKIELNITKENKSLSIEISDEGMGISSEDLNKIFEPFYRTKPADEIAGSGLGLSIVKRAVELHNGNISVESELGKWTKFRVTIPITPVVE